MKEKGAISRAMRFECVLNSCFRRNDNYCCRNDINFSVTPDAATLS